MKRETNAIYFWKIIFTYMIVIFHFYPFLWMLNGKGCVVGWYIAVEFFFMVSGYLLYDNIDRYKTQLGNAWSYTLHRYKAIWGKYIISFMCIFIIICIEQSYKVRSIAGALIDAFPEMILLQGVGLNRGWNYINPTLWYLSVLIIGGYIIYWFLIYKEELFVKIIAPIVVVVGYSYLYRMVGSMDAVIDTVNFYENQALIRGICDMCMGIFAVKLNRWMRKEITSMTLLRLVGVTLFVAIILMSMISGNSTNDFTYVLLLVPAVAIGFIPYKQTKWSPFISRWSSITLNIYLVHDLFRAHLMPMFFYNVAQGKFYMPEFVIYITLVTMAAIILETLECVLKRVIRRKLEENRGTCGK